MDFKNTSSNRKNLNSAYNYCIIIIPTWFKYIEGTCKDYNRSNEDNFENLKIRTYQASRGFFHADLEKEVIRPLAVRLGYIPADTDVLQLSKVELAELALICSEDNFLEEASRDGLVRGTREPLPPNSPCCKYSALFDQREIFDKIRLQFLIQADSCFRIDRVHVHE